VKFFVAGEPVTEGSIRNVGRRRNGSAILRHDRADELEVWRATIALAAREAGIDYHADGPVFVDLTFALPRPKSHFNAKGLKKSAPKLPTTKPDGDKLVRAVLDALSGTAYRDDSQVVDHACRKRYAAQFSPPGAFVEVKAATGADIEIRSIGARS
jgi:crossover junction endodeoxyribonuclease RusA